MLHIINVGDLWIETSNWIVVALFLLLSAAVLNSSDLV